MIKLRIIKTMFLFFFLGIAVIGCQNSTKVPSQSESKKEVLKVYLSMEVEGMTCSGSEKAIQNALIAIDGVDSAFATHVDKYVKVFVDTSKVSLQQMQNAIGTEGYTAGEILK